MADLAPPFTRKGDDSTSWVRLPLFMARGGLTSCPSCQGLGRGGDDLACSLCAGTGEVVRVRASDPAEAASQLLFAGIDRALSAAVGPDWRRTGFEVDVTIGVQTYCVAHSIYAPNQLQINDRTMYSDLWADAPCWGAGAGAAPRASLPAETTSTRAARSASKR